MRKGLVLLVAAFFVLDIAGGGHGGCNRHKQPHNGKVYGDVKFSGINCQPGQPDFNVPPCTGNYPNYKIEIYHADGKRLALTAMSNSTGTYNVELPNGEYVIYTQDGPKETNLKANTFQILHGKIERLDLTISTGIQ